MGHSLYIIQNMNRFAPLVFFAVLAVAAADTNTYQMPQDTFGPRQGFGGQASVGLGPFGEFNAGGNLQVPNGSVNFLFNAILVLGALSLIQTVATVVTPFLFGGDDEEPEAAERRARNIDFIRDQVFSGIQTFMSKYQ